MDEMLYIGFFAVIGGLFLIVIMMGRNYEQATVVEIIDGDTLLVNTQKYGKNIKLRLCGIDCPEQHDDSHHFDQVAHEATEFLAELLPVRTPIFLEFDHIKKDKYGRLLAFVYVSKTGKSVNAELIRRGYAFAKPYKNNLKHAQEFKKLESQAQRKRWGVWSKKRLKE
ncbi:MAG: thermonuclease family protein [Microscillaceae bacterium]|jgi:micrococcal nuclease|nr:thermonuclease family protein [Microscillaceae bacterium]